MAVIVLHVRRTEGDEIFVSDTRVHAYGQAPTFKAALNDWADMIIEMHSDLHGTMSTLAPVLVTRMKFLDRLIGTPSDD